MAARDKRRTDIAKFIEAVESMRIPASSPGEQAIWVLLARHGTKEGATRASSRLWERYVSVNEFRVAKVTEIADLIENDVKNDAIAVAEHARQFLRVFFQEFQGVDFAATEDRSPNDLKKYLTSLSECTREIAMALALHYCMLEVSEPEVPEDSEAQAKAKKRPEKDLTATANRLRLLFNVAAHGTVTAKEAHSGKNFVKAWAYKALPPPPKPPKVPKTPKIDVAKNAVAQKTAKKTTAKKTTAKKTTAKKTTAKKTTAKRTTAKKTTAKKTTAKKAPKKARVKTARPRASSKKSSRR